MFDIFDNLVAQRCSFTCIIDCMNIKKKSQIIIPAGTHPWPHELRVADILALS